MEDQDAQVRAAGANSNINNDPTTDAEVTDDVHVQVQEGHELRSSTVYEEKQRIAERSEALRSARLRTKTTNLAATASPKAKVGSISSRASPEQILLQRSKTLASTRAQRHSHEPDLLQPSYRQESIHAIAVEVDHNHIQAATSTVHDSQNPTATSTWNDGHLVTAYPGTPVLVSASPVTSPDNTRPDGPNSTLPPTTPTRYNPCDICCGFCCDYRIAVIAVNIFWIMLCLGSFLQLGTRDWSPVLLQETNTVITLAPSMAPTFTTMAPSSRPNPQSLGASGSFDVTVVGTPTTTNDETEFETLQQWHWISDDWWVVETVLASVGLVVAGIAMYGAIQFQWRCVLVGAIYLVLTNITSWVLIVVSWKDVYPTPGTTNGNPLAAFVFDMGFTLSFLYAHVGLLWQLGRRNYPMTTDTYPEQAYCCCCVHNNNQRGNQSLHYPVHRPKPRNALPSTQPRPRSPSSLPRSNETARSQDREVDL